MLLFFVNSTSEICWNQFIPFFSTNRNISLVSLTNANCGRARNLEGAALIMTRSSILARRPASYNCFSATFLTLPRFSLPAPFTTNPDSQIFAHRNQSLGSVLVLRDPIVPPIQISDASSLSRESYLFTDLLLDSIMCMTYAMPSIACLSLSWNGTLYPDKLRLKNA